MATDAIPTDRINNLFSELESRNSLLTTCTNLYKTVSDHFDKLHQTLQQRSHDLDSKIQTFDSHTKQTLDSLDQRENSIPDRESTAVARIEDLKQSALSEFENPIGNDNDIADALRSYCRKMDVNGLVKFLLLKRKESVPLRPEVAVAVEEAVDAQRLVLDAVEEFVNAKSGKQGVADRRWACVVLMQAVFPLGELPMERRGVAGSMMERAAVVAEKWKGVIESWRDGEELGAGEAAMFLQLVSGFGLRDKFEEEFLRKLVVEHAARRDMAKIAMTLGFGEKMKDIIEELVKSGKEIEAVYFAFESGLTEQFRPADLLKSYLSNSRKNVNSVLKNGNSNAVAMERATNLELSFCKAIIKCVEDYKLEPEFAIDNLKKRVTQLEKSKAEKRKSSASKNKSSNKRNRGGNSRDGGASSFRQSKAGRVSIFSPSFGHRNLPQPHQAPVARYSMPYNYLNQGVYESPGAVPYVSGYGATHTQSPAALSQQYSYASQDVGAGSLRNAEPYGVQTNYGAYDYNAAATTATHPHPQSHPPAYSQSYPQ